MHTPNLEKRTRYEALVARLNPLFNDYDGEPIRFLERLAGISGLPIRTVYNEIEELLEKWHAGDDAARIAFNTGADWIARLAVWGEHYD